MKDVAVKEEIETLLPKVGEDFALPVLSDDEATALDIQPEVAAAIANAVGAFLVNMPMEAGAIELGVVCEQKQPQTLPAVTAYPPTLPGCDPIKWRKVGKLPGFIDPRFRKLGNDVFNSFACFRAFAVNEDDAHAAVLTVSDFTNGQTETNFLARVIAERGEFVDLGHMDHGAAVPGYKPQIAVFMTDSWTFKLVRDSIENGAPVEADYIYAWPGGRSFYQPKLSASRPTHQRSLNDIDQAKIK